MGYRRSGGWAWPCRRAMTYRRVRRSRVVRDESAAGGRTSDPGFSASTGECVPDPRKLAGAFCQLLEAMDPQRMPLHGGDATTVMVMIGLDQLRAALAGADLGRCCVPGTTAAPTTTAICTPTFPTATSGSADGRE
jgi:hypothetical protein